jgi:hypothetical protein
MALAERGACNERRDATFRPLAKLTKETTRLQTRAPAGAVPRRHLGFSPRSSLGTVDDDRAFAHGSDL